MRPVVHDSGGRFETGCSQEHPVSPAPRPLRAGCAFGAGGMPHPEEQPSGSVAKDEALKSRSRRQQRGPERERADKNRDAKSAEGDEPKAAGRRGTGCS